MRAARASAQGIALTSLRPPRRLDALLLAAGRRARSKDNKMEAIVGKRMFEGVVVGVHSELDVALVRLTHEITKGIPRTPLAECEGGAPPAVELAGEDALLSIPPGTPVRSLGYPAPWTLNLKSSSARAGTRTGEGVLSGVAAVGSANEAAIAEEGGDAAAAVAAGKLHATHVAHNAGVSSGQSGGPVFAEDGAVLGISSVGGGGVEIAVSSNVLSEIVEGEGVESLSMGKWDRRALDMANKVLGVLGLST